MAKLSIEVACETLTPMITSGATTGLFDLRASVIKGLLRFWWRAFHAFKNISDMRAAEATLFGDTTTSSPFRLNVVVSSAITCTKTDLGLDGQGGGRSYFYFPLRTVSRRALKPAFTLSFHGIRSRDQAVDLLCAVWLLENLGGVGSRSRRGAGSFRITSVKTGDELLSALPLFHRTEVFGSAAEIGDWLKTSLHWIRTRWNVAVPPLMLTHPSLPDYTRWSECARMCLIRDTQPDELVLMDKLARDMRTFRDGNTKGNYNLKAEDSPFLKEAKTLHGRVDQMINGAVLSPVENVPFTKSAFGVPIQYRFGARRGQPEPLRFDAFPSINRKENGEDRIYTLERRASPLFLSFGRAAISSPNEHTDYAYCILTYLPAHFAGNQKEGESPMITFTVALDTKPVERKIVKIEGETKQKAILRDRLKKAEAINNLSDGDFSSAFPGYAGVSEYLDQMTAKTDLEVHQIYPSAN